MDIQLDTLLTHLNGDHVTKAEAGMRLGKDETKEAYQEAPVRLGDWILHVLLDVVAIEGRDGMGRPIPKQLGEREKFERYRLAEKVYNALDQDLPLQSISVDDAKRIKDCTADAANPEILGRVYRLLGEVD